MKVSSEVKDASELRAFAERCRDLVEKYKEEVEMYENSEVKTFPLISGDSKIEFETEEDYQISTIKSILEYLKNKKIIV